MTVTCDRECVRRRRQWSVPRPPRKKQNIVFHFHVITDRRRQRQKKTILRSDEEQNKKENFWLSSMSSDIYIYCYLIFVDAPPYCLVLPLTWLIVLCRLAIKGWVINMCTLFVLRREKRTKFIGWLMLSNLENWRYKLGRYILICEGRRRKEQINTGRGPAHSHNCLNWIVTIFWQFILWLFGILETGPFTEKHSDLSDSCKSKF